MKILKLNLSVIKNQLKDFLKIQIQIFKLFFNNQKRSVYFYPYRELTSKIENIHRKKIRSYEIAQDKYRKKVLNLKKISKTRKIKLFFLVCDLTLWCEDYFCKLLIDTKIFDVYIFICPNHSIDHQDVSESALARYNDSLTFFKSKGYQTVATYDSDSKRWVSLKDYHPEIIIYLSIGNTISQYNPEYTSLYALTIYIPYGIKTSSNKNWFFRFENYQFNRDQHHYLWKIFLESELHLKMKNKFSFLKKQNAVVVGHPKLDAYHQDLGKQENYKIFSNSQKYQKRVIWAPHFTIDSIVNCLVFSISAVFSTFTDNYLFFIDLFEKYQNIQWCFKPHPMLAATLHNQSDLEKEKVKFFYEAIEALPNVITFDTKCKTTYLELFKESDALITDSISFLTEYILSKKPLLFLKNKFFSFNAAGKKIIKNHYQAKGSDYGKIKKFIDQIVLGESDVNQEKRLSEFRRHFPELMQNSSENMKEFLLKELL